MYDLQQTMETQTSRDRRRFTIQLSDFEIRMLTLWAKLHGKPVATYAAQIVGARVEANARDIYANLEYFANSIGVSPEELEKQWLSEENLLIEEDDE